MIIFYLLEDITSKQRLAYLAQSVELSAVNRSVVGSSPTVGAINVAYWRRGLTHMPFTHAFMGSNPVRVTNLKNVRTKILNFQRFGFFMPFLYYKAFETKKY